MKVKVIIREGLASCVLADEEAKNVEVEIVDVCKDYEDGQELEDYATELENNENLTHIEYTVADFTENTEE